MFSSVQRNSGRKIGIIRTIITSIVVSPLNIIFPVTISMTYAIDRSRKIGKLRYSIKTGM
jgi:hypothetical protein